MKRLIAGLATGLLALGVGAITQPAAAADSIRQIGAIDLGNCYQEAWGVDSGLHLLIDEVQVQQGHCGTPPGTNFALLVYSTRTLQRLATVPITNPGGIDKIEVDEVHHRLLVLDSSASPAGGETVSVYSISRLKTTVQPLPADATISIPSTALGLGGAGSVSPGNLTGAAGDFSLHISGSAYDAATDQLYLTVFENFGGFNALTSQNGPGADDVYLADVDLHAGAVRWAQILDTCVFDTASTSLYHLGSSAGIGDPILVRHTAGGVVVNVGCAYSRSPGLAPDSQGSGVAGVVPGLTSGSMLTYTVPLDGSGAPVSGSISYALGRTHAYGGVADPGDARIFYASAPVNDGGSLSASSSGANAVVYDAEPGVYDGAVTISSAAYSGAGFQIATANHRLYSVGPDGVLVDSASSTPSGQGVWFSGYQCATAGLLVDAGLGRLIALPHTDCKSANSTVATKAEVLEDDYQLAPPAVAANPDSYTIQRAEAVGVTDKQYDGHAEATGTRIRLIGGLHGAVSGAGFGLYDQVFGALDALSQESGSPTVPDPVPADYATHELDLAETSGADLGNYQASAGSLAADADGATRQQLKGANGADWPFQPTSCSDPGTRQAQQQYGGDTNSSVDCQYGSKADSSSAAGPVTVTMYVAGQGQTTQQLPMPVDLGANVSSASVSLTPDRGLVSTASSEVKDVILALPGAGELRIDGVVLTVSCEAHGRTGTASCTTTRALNGVTYAGSAVGSGSCTEAPGVDTCGMLLAALNKIRPGILVFRMPGPDARSGFFGGSPGGYQSIAQREFYEHLQDQVLNYDDSEQVPGLQVVYVNDSISTPSRLDLQLGDVEAESHYGITLLPPPCSSCAGTAGPSLSLGPLAPTSHLSPPTAPPGLATIVSRILERVWNGLKVLLRSPAAALAAAALLLMLVSPLLMGMRRRQLELLLNEVSA